ncbi:hypothetical protein [Rhodanobacter sp. OK091]|uniref:hypothetical protein n=1 Tax=Rhodanobacter sp. OK091 TaxID=1881037 RepID=UPI0009346697|nr:hypothetical protein [Rhodanobacter sp. OK091]
MCSDIRATAATALTAKPAASLYRYALALAQADHDNILIRAHGTIRTSTICRKPAAAVMRHPSSGHMGGNNHSRADGDGMLEVKRPCTVRERFHWTGAGIGTTRSMRRAATSPAFHRAGAIRCTRPDA